MTSRAALLEVLREVRRRCARPGRLWLSGASSQLFEGWVDGARRLEVALDGGAADRGALAATLEAAAAAAGTDVMFESPGDVIPLPRDHGRRARPIADDDAADDPATALRLFHFDPYSAAFRALARGDEDDYRVVLGYLRHGWIEVAFMDRLLAELLPRFTSETIAQDPAEFRRKYRGLLQMWRAEQRRGEPVAPGPARGHLPPS